MPALSVWKTVSVGVENLREIFESKGRRTSVRITVLPSGSVSFPFFHLIK